MKVGFDDNYIHSKANFVKKIFAHGFRRWLLEWNRKRRRKNKAPPTTQQMSLNEPVQFKSVFVVTCGRTRLKIVELNFLRCSGRLKASLVGFCMPGSSEILEAWMGRKAFELWRRVFTTSSGQVTIAPAVPATLLNKTILVRFPKFNSINFCLLEK